MGQTEKSPTETIHCITCGEPLSSDRRADPFVEWLRCPNDHRFFRMTREADRAALETAAAADPFAEEPPPAEIAARWLRDPAAREHLNPQLALALARFESGLDRRVPPFGLAEFCPNCGKTVRGMVHGDPGLRGLVCENGHESADRQGRIWLRRGGETLVLARELPDESWLPILEGWLGGDARFQQQLAPSVRLVLEEFRRSLLERDEGALEPHDPH